MQDDILKSDFNFFVPIEFEKSKEEEDGLPKELIITGVASTNDKDSDGEMLDPNGYDLTRFLQSGFLNLEHRSKDDTSNIVGEPIEAKVKDNKLWIKGKLYKSNPKAVNIYKTAKMLKAEKSNRRLGYSIEGRAIQRDPSNPKRILKASIHGCAVTATPKNSNTYLDILKGEYEKAYIQPDFDETANGGAEYLLDITRPDGTRIKVDKGFNVTIDKAMSAGHATGRDVTGQDTNGAALKKESVDKKLRNMQYFMKSVLSKLADKAKKGELTGEKLELAKNIAKNFYF